MKEHLKILLLEDSETDAEIITHLLKKTKPLSEFRLVMDEPSFINALDEFRPDLILSDNSMPQFSAKDALEITQLRNLQIPFIMVTGSATEEFAAWIIKLGADDYIIKDRMARLPVAIDAALKQKKAEREKLLAYKKVKESENNLKTIFENTAEGFLLMGIDGTVKALNKNSAQYGLLVSKKEIEIGDNIFDFMEKERSEAFKEMFDRVMKDEEFEYERSFPLPDGNVKWIEFSVMPVKENEKITGICVNGSDITEKKKIEQEREFDRNNLTALINNTNDLMWSVDRNFELITFNRAFSAKIKSASGKPVYKGSNALKTACAKDQIKRFKEYYERAFNGSSFIEIEHDEDTWSEISFYPIHNKNEVIGTACFSRDITERKKAEEELKLSEIRLKEAQTIGHISNYEVDLAQRIHTWSDEYYRIFGLKKNKVKPSLELFLSLIHPDDVDFARKTISDAFESFTDSAFDFRFIRNDGIIRYGHSKFKFEFDKARKPVRLFGILQDVTERKEAELTLKILQQEILDQKVQEQKRVTRAMIIAQEKERNHLGEELHDNINQILAGTKLYLGMIGQENSAFKELIKYPMELIDNSIEEIRLLCHRLVTPLKNIDLDQMVRDLLDTFSQNANIVTGFNYSLPSLVLNDDLKLTIYRIIQEQINNIVKYAQAKNVNVSITEKDGVLAIAIKDDGVGFNTDAKRKGIGISNMMHRIESYNGTIEIISSPGSGCTIDIKIPC